MGIASSSDESKIWLKINSIPMFHKKATTPYMVYSTYEDITWYREQEKEQMELERQMLHSQKLESLGVMAGGVAHDFNNLLQSIIGNLELALREIAENSRPQKHIANAMISCRHAAHLTNLMLTYTGSGYVVKKELSLNDLIRENVSMLQATALSAVSTEMHLSPEIPSILADEAGIQQIVMNLIINAAESIETQPGIIRLTTGFQRYDKNFLAGSLLEKKPEPGLYLFLDVSDNGCGISEENLTRLFDPFFTTKFSGRGLGMSAVMGIIKVHGGALFVESEPGKGTTFKILLPTQESAVAGATSAQINPIPPQPAFTDGELSGMALVVDDEKSVLKTCAKMVKLLGFTVITASDGVDAVVKFREHADEIVIVLMDLTMPKMDGISAMNEIYGIRPGTRVLLASGFNEEELGERLQGQQPSGFIRKPYSMNELEAEIRRVMRVAEASPTGV
jgi:signal transduction histidine kinase/CheY-like chemotaxis protein